MTFKQIEVEEDVHVALKIASAVTNRDMREIASEALRAHLAGMEVGTPTSNQATDRGNGRPRGRSSKRGDTPPLRRPTREHGKKSTKT